MAFYPAHLSRRLLLSALFHGPLTTISAVSNGQFDRGSSGCGWCAALIMLTSINYWRHPLLGMRRSVDMISSAGCFIYQLRASASAPTGACVAYYSASTGILGCYALSRYCNFVLGNKYLACRFHLMVHACTGFGSLVLYDALGRNAARWSAA